MEIEILNAVIADACIQVKLADQKLFDVRATERTFQFRLAHYLACDERIPSALSVDCEYSRHGEAVKRITTNRPRTWLAPDIIIHGRTNDNDNLAAIELKLSHNSKGAEKDRQRLRNLCRKFDYRCAFLILINMDSRSLDIESVSHEATQAPRYVQSPM